MKPNRKNDYSMLIQVIDQMVADNLDKNTITSLRNMLELPAFFPIHDVIEKKIIEVGNFLKSKEPPAKQEPIMVYMGTPKKVEPITPAVPLDGVELEDCGWAPFEYDERESRNLFEDIKKKVDNQLDFDIVLPTLPDEPPEKV